MKRDQKELREQIHDILWHMRGGVTREEAWTLSQTEREDIGKDIKERIKNVESTGIPLI